MSVNMRLRLSFAAAAFLQISQPSFAQQREPIDGDQADYITAYCSENYQNNFASYDACTLWVANHSVINQSSDGGSYFIFLPSGDYETYHYTLPG
jgi:hypothetical protein